jgi:hypothetical protein
MKRDPYPLQWPPTWTRAKFRQAPKFIARFAQDRDSVIRQLKMRGGSHVVITSDLPIRMDGLPYANATCSDPGIAIYWVEKGHEHVIACDRWRTAAQNLRAIELSLEAMRGIARWGTNELVERTFAGFAALPAGKQEPTRRHWREVFGVEEGSWSSWTPRDQLAFVKAKHRALIRQAHPDVGGSHEAAAELNAALAEAEQELS